MRVRSSFWLWSCIAFVALFVVIIFSTSGIVSFRSIPSTPVTTLPCANGVEDAEMDCDLEADFEDDFDLNPNFQGAGGGLLDCFSFTGLLNPLRPSGCFTKRSNEISQEAVFLKGMNLLGGHFPGDLAKMGEFLPFDNDAALFIWKGMNTFRIPISWEYVADIRGNLFLESFYLDRLDALIQGLLRHDVVIILDLHNYMRYNPENITLNLVNRDPLGSDVIGLGSQAPSSTDFAHLWSNLAARYGDQRVIYQVMAGPHDVSFSHMNSVFIEAIQAIKATETEPHIILLPGNHLANLSSWFDLVGGQTISNAENVANFRRNLQVPLIIGVQQHFDADLIGRYVNGECMESSLFRAHFDANWAKYVNWSRANNITTFMTAVAAPDTETCKANLLHFLDALEAFPFSDDKGYGVIGWTAFAAGHELGEQSLCLAPGCRANVMIWDENVYGRYLTERNISVPPIENRTRALQISNHLNVTLVYSGGYVPFQFRGSASIEPGKNGTLYSNNKDSTPIGDGGLEIKYTLPNNDREIFFGFTPQVNGLRSTYGIPENELSSLIVIESFSDGCPIASKNAVDARRAPRCFIVKRV